eukprot:CAMPEP_0183461708 /NCGR_PEP_ID=MMETSP0370-20130417/140190_1 /TAXON_ID=268820 /ORGANISM="Peridinium aciculiferum, Strain PAER-2" /LENGTH=36 /DNA_ID= /DNA_START= /DNA_END= /DNA_ORIENTATION=
MPRAVVEPWRPIGGRAEMGTGAIGGDDGDKAVMWLL